MDSMWQICFRVVSRLCSLHPHRSRPWHFQTAYEFGGLARDEPRNGRRAKGNQLSSPSSASELRATAHCLLGTTPKLPQRKGELKRKAAPEVTLFFSLAGFLVALSVQRLTCISLSLSLSLPASVRPHLPWGTRHVHPPGR